MMVRTPGVLALLSLAILDGCASSRKTGFYTRLDTADGIVVYAPVVEVSRRGFFFRKQLPSADSAVVPALTGEIQSAFAARFPHITSRAAPAVEGMEAGRLARSLRETYQRGGKLSPELDRWSRSVGGEADIAVLTILAGYTRTPWRHALAEINSVLWLIPTMGGLLVLPLGTTSKLHIAVVDRDAQRILFYACHKDRTSPIDADDVRFQARTALRNL